MLSDGIIRVTHIYSVMVFFFFFMIIYRPGHMYSMNIPLLMYEIIKL